MTPEENIASLNTQLAAARQELANDQADAVANSARTADWMDKVQRMGPAADSDAALASCAADKARIDAEISADNALISDITAQLAAATSSKATSDAAYAQASAEGLTGEAANIRAQAIVTEAESAAATQQALIYGGIAIALIALIAFIWYRFKKRSK